MIEADEYDTAFFDKRSKFVHYRPRTAVLNNLEFDHADIFDDLAPIERQFHHLVRTVPPSGRVVVNGLEESLARVLHAGCWSEVASFGAAVSDFSRAASPHTFDVLRRGQGGACEWALGGVHNQLNALAAIAAADHAVGVEPDRGGRGAGALRERAPAHGSARHRCAASASMTTLPTTHGDAHHARWPAAPGGRPSAHPRGVRARSNTMKLGTMKAQLPGASSRPTWPLPPRPAGLGRRSAGADGRPRRTAADRPTGDRPGWQAAGRPHRVHEQRRLWRHPHAMLIKLSKNIAAWRFIQSAAAYFIFFKCQNVTASTRTTGFRPGLPRRQPCKLARLDHWAVGQQHGARGSATVTSTLSASSTLPLARGSQSRRVNCHPASGGLASC